MKHLLVLFLSGTALGLVGPTVSSKEIPPETLKRKDEIVKLFHEEFVALTPGKGAFPASFMMGSAADQPPGEQPLHKVTFGRDFAIGKFEVTQELYFVIMGKNPAKWKGTRNSVEMVNWHEADNFCAKVTDALRTLKLLADGEEIRLPSEAEWEYACRAGSSTAYSFGDAAGDLGKYAWYKANAPGNDPPVGKKLPNAWGLYDMHGYVWEWCSDTMHPNYANAPTDGSAWETSESKQRMIRGGSYADPADAVRSASRRAVSADLRSDTIGFRCVRAEKK